MQVNPKLPCPHCGRSVDLVEGHFRVPRFGRRWWQWGDEVSRYKCAACEGISRVQLSPLGLALMLSVAAVGVGGWHFHLNRHLLLGGAAIALFVIAGQCRSLTKA